MDDRNANEVLTVVSSELLMLVIVFSVGVQPSCLCQSPSVRIVL